jgi:hypothetical protein
VRVLVWCKACRHQADADLQVLVDAGRGDVPLNRLPFRCDDAVWRSSYPPPEGVISTLRAR